VEVKSGAGYTPYYYHADGLGSITGLSDATGTMVQTYGYDAFGQVTATGGISQPFMFTGREYDAETSMYFYRARYYDPVVGRFVTKDPIGFGGGVNLYNYAGNNPQNFIDPFGLITPGSKEHRPPGWNDNWKWQPGSRGTGNRWWDPEGGEWRWHAPDKYHDKGHWDYNPWDKWNSPWRNVPGEPPEEPQLPPPPAGGGLLRPPLILFFPDTLCAGMQSVGMTYDYCRERCKQDPKLPWCCSGAL